ncbi:hypothetical protein T484DRAFT_1780185 [Baffinella frigidus]|nr:hypothetical protein T484DRAFT_1780185 [Cryptophyta sp. CCMP2293]
MGSVMLVRNEYPSKDKGKDQWSKRLANGSRGAVIGFATIAQIQGTAARLGDVDKEDVGKAAHLGDFEAEDVDLDSPKEKADRDASYPVVQFLNGRVKLIAPLSFEVTSHGFGSAERVQADPSQ